MKFQHNIQSKFGSVLLVREAIDFVCQASSVLTAKDQDALLSLMYACRPQLLPPSDSWKSNYFTNLCLLIKSLRLLLRNNFYLIDSHRFYRQFYTELEERPQKVLSLSLLSRLLLGFAQIENLTKFDKSESQGEVQSQIKEKKQKFISQLQELWKESQDQLREYLNFAQIPDLIDLSKAHALRSKGDTTILQRIAMVRIHEFTPLETLSLYRSFSSFEMSQKFISLIDQRLSFFLQDTNFSFQNKCVILEYLTKHCEPLTQVWKVFETQTQALFNEEESTQVQKLLKSLELLCDAQKLSDKIVKKYALLIRMSKQNEALEKLKSILIFLANHPARVFEMDKTRMPTSEELKFIKKSSQHYDPKDFKLLLSQKLRIMNLLARQRRFPTSLLKRVALEVKKTAHQLSEPGLDLRELVDGRVLRRVMQSVERQRRKVGRETELALEELKEKLQI